MTMACTRSRRIRVSRWSINRDGPVIATLAVMKHLSATETELPEILVWERSFRSLTDEQKSLCIALHRNTGPMHEDELATYLDCSIEDLRNAKIGVYGILIDSSTRKYWIK